MSMICASTRALNLRLRSIRFRRAGLNLMTNTSVLSQAWLSKELRPWDDVDGRIATAADPVACDEPRPLC